MICFGIASRALPEHGQRTLTGPDPNNPSQTITQSVSKWFDAPTRNFMAVLSDPTNGWIIKGDATRSRFVTDLLGTENPMSEAFNTVVPNSGGKTCKQILIAWIVQGCPLPPVPARAREALAARAVRPRTGGLGRLTLTSSESEVMSHPRHRVQGMGCVH